jgi:SAM-dependent methyltransferase
MTDTTPHDVDQQRTKVVNRYSGLARQAMAGHTPTDACATKPGNTDCLGATQYATEETAPDGALRASLGCGNPLAVADIAAGETVLDLGSGGGLDVILSARRTGPTGKVYGLDASPDMLTLARTNARDVDNAEFLHGHLENIPLPDCHVDVVISNCVVNLSADKPRVLAEAFRVLKFGGRLGITDITSDEGLDEPEKAVAEKQVGCASGTVTTAAYRDQLLAAGFTAITITPTHQVAPGLSSVIVQATKPDAPTEIV